MTTYRNAAEHFTLRERSTIPATNAFREAVPPFHATEAGSGVALCDGRAVEETGPAWPAAYRTQLCPECVEITGVGQPA